MTLFQLLEKEMKEMNQQPTFSIETIRELVNQGMNVREMAEYLQVDFEMLSDFYCDCSKSDRAGFPIRLLITKPWLEEKLKTLTVSDICAETKTSISVINRLCKTYGIEKKPMLKTVLSPEVMHSLFVEQRLTDKEIASRYSFSTEWVKKLRRNYGISSDTRTMPENRMSIELFHRLFVEYGFTIKHLASMLEAKNYAVIDLKAKYSEHDGQLAKEICERKKYYAFHDLIELLFEELEPVALLEQLKNSTLAEVAEMYGIIPAPIAGVTTFSKEWLEILLNQRLSLDEIMATYHVGRAFLEKLIKDNEIHEPTPEEFLDEKLIQKLYCEDMWSDEEIAQSMHVATSNVAAFRKKHKIKRSKRYEISQRLPLDDFKKLYLIENMTLVQIAEMYDVSDKTISSLKALYAKQEPTLLAHTSGGVSKERFMFLKKRLHFKNFN